jgi:cytochrome c oxidase subunit 2
VKQDAVPGLSIDIGFTLDKPGNYEIACAELCGANHFAMRGFLTVHPDEDAYRKWVQEEWTSSH